MSVDPSLELIAPRGDEERRLLAELIAKYDRMLELRARLGRGTPDAPDRDILRRLSTDYPGALRELETVSTNELTERAVAARATGGAALVPAWLLWTARYHAEMRALLAQRRDPRLRKALHNSPHGRLNVVCFTALEVRFSVPRSVIWHRLFPVTGAKLPPHRK